MRSCQAPLFESLVGGSTHPAERWGCLLCFVCFNKLKIITAQIILAWIPLNNYVFYWKKEFQNSDSVEVQVLHHVVCWKFIMVRIFCNGLKLEARVELFFHASHLTKIIHPVSSGVEIRVNYRKGLLSCHAMMKISKTSHLRSFLFSRMHKTQL